MKYFISITSIVILSLSCGHGIKNAEQAEPLHFVYADKKCDYYVKVVGITDGDTFKGLTNSNEEIKFRIYAIDAPEKKQDYGDRAKQYLSALIFGKTVGIKVQRKSDQYGRPIVWVFTEDGKDVSAEMLKAGMAWHYKRYDSTPEYADYESKARKAKLGLWADKHPVSPWDFKKGSKSLRK
ncbi:MAG: thermonuclease family protein [Tannerella sp.]|jgi:endonuclease YncB( thermonuclease family)|nr:thermonuclease family protein [Tannerella sp.]